MQRKKLKKTNKNKSQSIKPKKNQKNRSQDAKKIEKAFFKKSFDKNEATASTLATRSDPDRPLRMSKGKIMKLKDSCNSRFPSEFREYPCKFSIDLKENKFPSQFLENDEGLSFRQYLTIDGKWYPVLTSTQRNRISYLPKCGLKKNSLEKQQTRKNSQKKNQQVQYDSESSIKTQLQKLEKRIMKQKYNNENLSDESDKKSLYTYCKRIIGILQDDNNLKNTECKNSLISFSDQIPKIQQISHGFPNSPERGYSPESQKQSSEEENSSPIKQLNFGTSIQDNHSSITEDQLKLGYTERISCRQYFQLGYISEQISKHSIATNSIAIGKFIDSFFEMVSSKYWLGELIQNLSLAYGYPKLKKYSRICQQRSLVGHNPQLLSDQLFEFYIQQNFESDGNKQENQIIHNKCIFDAINQQIVKLKPYYESSGECFPWSLKLSAPITFYDINQQTIGSAFSQIKNQILTYSSILCGLIVEPPINRLQNAQFSQILSERRRSRQSYMLKQYLQEQSWKNNEQNNVEFVGIRLMTNIADEIFMDLIQEIHI